jgi:hypothetical protein
LTASAGRQFDSGPAHWELLAMRYRLRTLLNLLAVIIGITIVAAVQIQHWRTISRLNQSIDAVYSFGGRVIPDKRPLLAAALIDLSGTSIANDDLEQFCGLVSEPALEMDVSGTGISDDGIKYLAPLRLSRLDLRGTRVTKAGVDSLRLMNPDLEVEWTSD